MVDKLAIVVLIIVTIGVLINWKVILDSGFVFLLFAMLYSAIIDYKCGAHHEIAYASILPGMYLIGKMASYPEKENAEKTVAIPFWFVTLGLVVLGTIDLCYSRIINYRSTEQVMSFILKDTYVRTILEQYFLLYTSCLGYFIYKTKRKKCLFGLAIVLALCIVADMVYHEGRYNLFIMILQVPVAIMIVIFHNWINYTIQQKKILRNVLGIVIGIIALVIVAFLANIGGIYNLYKNSYLSGSGGIIHNVRFEYMYLSIKNIPTHLAGGYNEGRYSGAHNTWLDYGDKFGIGVLSLLLIFKCIMLYRTARIAFNRKIDIDSKLLIVPAYLFYNIYFSMEPIGFRRRLYLAFFLVISGVVSRTYEIGRKKYTS